MTDEGSPFGFEPRGPLSEEADLKTSVLGKGDRPPVPESSDGFTPSSGPTALGHFDVLETIGRGGFGVVVKAFDRSLCRVVAIKTMPPEMAATSPARKRFVREARAAAAVRHDNVVCIYAVEEHPTPHLVMEYVSGGSLQQHLDRVGPLETREVLRFGAQIARGLAAAHATGLVHRDIKPANVLLEAGDASRAKLTDFGIARAADDASLTQSGMVVGTPMYMAPEQAKGERVDHRADLFSLGSVLYTMVTGRPPFRAENSLAVLKRVADETPRPIEEIIPETPEWLRAIIAKLHARDPANRFQSAAEVADLLEQCLAYLDRGHSMPPPAAAFLPRPRRKRRVGLAIAGVVLAAVAVACLVRFWPTSSVQPGDVANAPADPPVVPTTPAGDPPTTPPSTPPQASHPPAPIDQSRYKNALGMEFVRVPAGTTRLGGGDGVAGTELVTFDHDFYMGVFEVTQGDWEKVLGPGKNPSRFSRTGKYKAQVTPVPEEVLERFPVEGVSWDETQGFIRQLNKLVREDGWEYRLPRSAEWEYACRGGPALSPAELGQDFYLATPSRSLDAGQANFFATGLRRPCPVGSYPPNRLGLHDMHGNVFELCDDIQQQQQDGSWHCAIRGGFWGDRSSACRAGIRTVGGTEDRYDGAGFRLVRVPIAKPAPKTRYLAPEREFEAFVAELRWRNPDLICTVSPVIADGRIVGLGIPEAKPLRDISPIRMLPHLERIEIWGGSFGDLTPLRGMPLRELVLNNNWVLADLSPLQGMKLERLEIWGFQGDDLSPVVGMPLRRLNCGGAGKKVDLTVLRGMPLTNLCISGTQVEDLAPLKELPLEVLMIKSTRVRDLAPLQGTNVRELHFDDSLITDLTPLRKVPLVEINLQFRPGRDIDVLRSIPTLAIINKKPANAFWKERDKK